MEIEINRSSINKKNQWTYSLSEKLKAIEFAEKTSNYKAGIIYKVNESTIRYWRKMKELYMPESNRLKVILIKVEKTII